MPVAGRFKNYLIAGISACGGAAICYFGNQFSEKQRAYASYIANFNPSVKWDYNWDRMEPDHLVKPCNLNSEESQNKYNRRLEKVRPTATRHLILIRHGQYIMADADKDKILTELGRKQAVYTGQRLRDIGLPYTKIIHSTMIRAVETAQLIHQFLPELPISDCNMLCEGAPIPTEPPSAHWKPDFYFYRDGARIEAAFRKYFHRAFKEQKEDSYEILVCHANVIRYFVCRALQFPPEAWLRFSLNHASITWLSIRPSGRVSLRLYGDSGHIPVQAVTS